MRDRAYFEQLVVDKLDGLSVEGVADFRLAVNLFPGQPSVPDLDNYIVVVFRGGVAERAVKQAQYTGTFRFGVVVRTRRREALMAVLDEVEVLLLETSPDSCTTVPETLEGTDGRLIVAEVEYSG